MTSPIKNFIFQHWKVLELLNDTRRIYSLNDDGRVMDDEVMIARLNKIILAHYRHPEVYKETYYDDSMLSHLESFMSIVKDITSKLTNPYIYDIYVLDQSGRFVISLSSGDSFGYNQHHQHLRPIR